MVRSGGRFRCRARSGGRSFASLRGARTTGTCARLADHGRDQRAFERAAESIGEDAQGVVLVALGLEHNWPQFADLISHVRARLEALPCTATGDCPPVFTVTGVGGLVRAAPESPGIAAPQVSGAPGAKASGTVQDLFDGPESNIGSVLDDMQESIEAK